MELFSKLYLILMIKLGFAVKFKEVKTALEYLRIQKFTIVTSNPDDIGHWYKENYSVRLVINDTRRTIFGDLVIDLDDPILVLELLTESLGTVLVLETNGTLSSVLGILLQFNRKIFFLDQWDWKLKEAFEINGRVIRNELGTVLRSPSHQLVPTAMDDFLERRSNLFGTHFQVLVELQRPALYLKPGRTLDKIPSIRTRSGDEVIEVGPELLNGFYHDVLELLRVNMNFTLTRFKRKDGVWGNLLPNQTWTGLISSLAKGDFDFAATGVTFMEVRSTVIDYLFPLGKETSAMFLKRAIVEEELDWTLFLEPFSRHLWLLLVVNGVVCVLVLMLLDYFYVFCFNQEPSGSAQNILNYSWMVICSYFAMKPPMGINVSRAKMESKILIFCIFLIGNVIFMTYRASLTSELSVRGDIIPFSNPYELLDQDFHLASRAGSASEYHFTSAQPNSIFDRLFQKFQENQAKADMFLDTEEDAIQKALQEPNTILYSFVEELWNRPETFCNFIVPWESHYPGLNSMAFVKSSRYREFFQFRLLQLAENGALASIHRKWLANHHCDVKKDLSLGYRKLGSLFVFLGTSFLIAILLFVGESLLGRG